MSQYSIVSVITPVLNGRRYLEACIKSVLNQTYPHVEHVLVDGGSTDGSIEIIQKFAEKFPGKVRLIMQTREGIGGAWNEGIDHSSGRILGWVGADDTYEPGAASQVADFFEANPEAVFVYGGQNFIDEDGRIIVSCSPEPYDYKTLLNKKQMIHTTSAFFKRQVIKAVGGLDSLGNDYDFYLRVGRRFPIHVLNRVLSNFRIHGASGTTGSSVSKRRLWLRAWHDSCLRHGGSRFSSYCVKFYLFTMLGWALPVWNFLYYNVLKIFKKRLI